MDFLVYIQNGIDSGQTAQGHWRNCVNPVRISVKVSFDSRGPFCVTNTPLENVFGQVLSQLVLKSTGS